MKLSPHEVADLCIKAGFSKTTVVAGTTDSEAVVAVAIALAESGGDTEAISRTTAPLTSDPKSVGNRDHGLFQLSGRWQYPRIQAKAGDWRDPTVNTVLAYEIFVEAKRSFSPWTTFKKENNKAAPFEQYLPDARLAVQQPWPYPDPQLSLQRTLDNLAASLVELGVAGKATASVLGQIRKHFS